MWRFILRIKHFLRPRSRFYEFVRAPRLYREHFRYALRLALGPEYLLPVWVTSPAGTRFALSNDPVDDAIVREILEHPEALFPSLAGRTAGSRVILDVGGHHGLYLAEALRRYPEHKFIVVEPHPDWRKLIELNAKANGGLERTRIANVCLAHDRQTRKLCFDRKSSWGATIQPGGEGNSSVEVQSLPLPDILEGSAPQIIYCNAEGAEYCLADQLEESGIRPEVMVIMLHPEYGDGEQFRRKVRAMDYIEVERTRHANRPIFHYFRKDIGVGKD